MTTARRATATVTWDGTDISDSLDRYMVDLTYTDRLHGMADDLAIRLLDRDLRAEPDADVLSWSADAQVQQGDALRAYIDVSNWTAEGDNRTLDCGAMVVDEVSYSSPPSAVAIKATSIPPSAGAGRTRKTRAWEVVDLESIAGDVASAAGWTLVYDLSGAPTYDRIDQHDETDLELVQRLAGQLGGIVKVWNGQLVVSDEASLDARPPIVSLVLGTDRIKGWSYKAQSHTRYNSCRVSYWDHWTRKLISHTEGSGEPVLEISARAKSKAEAMSKAKGELSRANRGTDGSSASLPLVGNPDLCAGCTVSIATGTGLDNIYIVTQAVHRIGSGGYTTDLSLRLSEV